MKHNGKPLAVLLLALAIIGCSSIRARSNLPTAEWPLYPGVRQDLQEMTEIVRCQRPEPVWVQGLIFSMLLVDLPASGILDTLAAPYDVYRLYSSPKKSD